MIGDIMTVSRLRMGTDGKGVTTLVAFFDCPLNCKYCINDCCHDHDDEYFFKEVARAAYTPKELVKVLKKDEIYYLMSGGGVTFGGGEPLLQSAFIHEVCKLADPEWKIRIDIKDMDEWIYEEYTGKSNRHVLKNLSRMEYIVGSSKFHIRVPRIPGFNDEDDIKKSVEWIRRYYRVEPEVFDYYRIEKIIDPSMMDDEEDDDDK